MSKTGRRAVGGSVVGVIDYHTGNSQSVCYALDHMGVPNRLMRDPHDLEDVDRVVLPGVGSAGTTMQYLSKAGWLVALDKHVIERDMPFLGVCVGLQVLFESSSEQDAECIGWLPGTVRSFDPEVVRVPQMGWNAVRPISSHPFLAEIPKENHFYFVNSYHAVPADPADAAAVTEYGAVFTSVVARRNIMATQFHIEKSGPIGLELLSRFASLPQGVLC
jgi:glutamine amidotransferase